MQLEVFASIETQLEFMRGFHGLETATSHVFAGEIARSSTGERLSQMNS